MILTEYIRSINSRLAQGHSSEHTFRGDLEQLLRNLLLAAIGGIMVPTFIMPDFMQTVAKLSPMNWGLEGYLDILLRQGTLNDILPEVGKLILLATGLFTLALFFYGRRTTA